MKRITSSLLALLLALSMLIGMVPAAYAATADTIESIDSTETVGSTEMEDVPAESENVATYAAEGGEETVTSIDLNTFIKWLADENYSVDGSKYSWNKAAVTNGKLNVTLKPEDGCIRGEGCSQTHEGIEHDSVLTNRNVPYKVNSGLAQFYIANNGDSPTDGAVSISNVRFTFNAADFVLYGNTGNAGTFTASTVRSGQLYFRNTGNVTVENCEFEKTVLTTFEATGTTVVSDCSFKDVYNSYAIKDIRGANITVKNTAITNCGGGIMISQPTDTTAVNSVTLSGNTFTNVDSSNEWSKKPTTRGIIQIAASGKYDNATLSVTNNNASNCGPVLRQMNSSATEKVEEIKEILTEQFKSDLYTENSTAKPTEPTAITTSEQLIAAIAAAKDGDTITLGEGEFTTYDNTSPKKSLTFVGSGAGTIWTIGDLNKHTKGEANGDYSFDGCNTITFKSMKLRSDSDDYRGFIRVTNTVVEDCVLDGKTAYWGYGTAKFINSTFKAPEGDYALWAYSTKDMTFDGCTFNISGKGVNVYVEAGNAGSATRTVTVKDCTVNSTAKNKAFLNIKNSTQAYDVTFSGTNTVTGLDADGTTNSNLFQVETTEVAETSGKPVTVKEKAANGTETVIYEVKASTELTNYVTLDLVYGEKVPADVVAAAKALYEGKQYETAKAANEAFMALYGVGWVERAGGTPYLNVTDNTAPLYAYAADADAVKEVKYSIHGTLAGFTSLVSDGNNIDCTVGGNHQIPRTSITITGVDNADGSKAQLTDGNVQAYVAGGYASKFRTSGKLTIDNIEFTSTTSTTVGASASVDPSATQTVSSAEMEIKNCVFRGRLYVYDDFQNEGKMTYNIHDNVFDGTNYSGDDNAYAIFAQCRGGNNLIIKNNEISGFARGINIDHANITATIEGNTISITDSGRSCIQLSSLAKAEIKDNTLNLTGGNALTLHEKLLTMTTAPEITVTGNTITGNGYLIYDDAVANGKTFTSENLNFTFDDTNKVAEAVNTKVGKKDKEYGLSSFVDTAVNGSSAVAKIGNTPYATLAEAVKAAVAGDTITLLSDIELTSAQKISKKLTLDLNGKTLDSTAYRTIQLNFGADLTVQDSGGTGKIANSYNGSSYPSTVYLYAKGTVFTLVSGTIESDPYETSLQSVAINSEKNNACTVNIQGGSVVVPAAAKEGRAIVASTNSMTLNISDGKIAGGLHGIDAYSGSTVNITGGKVTATHVETGVIKEAYGMRIIGTANVTINGGEIQGIKMDDNGYKLDVPNVTLVSGKVNGSFYSISTGIIVFTVDPTATITFENDTVKNFLPSTVELVRNEDGTYGVTKKVTYVAEVNGNKYETLQAAIDAARGGSTVRLLANVTLTETAVFPAGKKVDLSLAGHNITAAGTALRINGKTDIQSTGSNGVIESTGNVAVAVGDNASLTVYSGTLKGREGAVITGTSTGAKIEIRYKATLIATDNAVIAGNGSKRNGNPNTILVKGSTFIGGIVSEGYIACGIYAPWNDNVTVSGGTFNINNGAGIVARAGNVKVTGGTFNCGDGQTYGWVGDSKNKVPNAALVFDKVANYPALTESSQILVSGGTFSTDPAANGAKLADGYVARQTDGMYKVGKAEPVAEINGVKYDTLQAAINAAQAEKGGATITLLKNINTESYYTVNGDNPVTIDLAGCNITGSGISGLFYVTVKGDLTIKGEGTVTAVEDNGAAMAVWVRSSFAKVTLEGGTYTQQITNTADPHFDLIYVEYGNVYVKGGTYNGVTPRWTLNCKDENYPKEANIEVTGGTFHGFDPSANPEGEGTTYVKTGYVSTANGDGTYGVKLGTYVAAIGEKKYATLAAAVEAAKNGDTITLIADVEQNTMLVIDKDITLDLAGKKIFNTTDIWSGENGTYELLSIEAKVTITGSGTIDAKENDCYTINVKNGDLTIENGTFYGNISVVQVEAGMLTINGGKFDLHQKWKDKNTYLINCIDKAFVAKTAKVAIYGGEFVDFDPNVSPEQKIDGKTPSFAAPGVGITKNENNTFTAQPNMAAQIMDADGNSVAAYATLKEAVNAAKSGETVIVLKEATVEEMITAEANITIDLNQKTVTVADGAGTMLKTTGDVTIKNGTLTSAVTANIINAYGKLKLESVKIYGSTVDGSNLVNVLGNAEVTIDAASEIEADGVGVAVFVGAKSADKDAKYTLNIYGKVTQKGKSYAISGNGSYPGASYINIYEGAEVKANNIAEKKDCCAIYQPQAGEINVYGGLVEGYCAIVMKSGTLNISGGTVRGIRNGNVLGDNNSAGNGASYDGSAIVVDSRKTGYAGNVKINVTGGTVESYYSTAIREIGNDSSMTQLVELTVTGGEILGASKNLTNTENDILVRDISVSNVAISGGTFNHEVQADYCAVGYQPAEKDAETGKYTVKAVDGNVYYMDGDKIVYGDLMTLLNDSEFTGTVYLFKEIKVTSRAVFVDSSVTIDLNGKNLKISGKLLSFGKVIDSTDGEGLLTVGDMTGSQMPSDNGYLPVKDGTGYRLYQYTMEHYYGGVFGTEASKRFIFQITFTNTDAWRKLSTDDNSVVLSYEGAWNGNTKLFRFTDSTLDGMGKASNIGTTGYFTMTISGLDKLGSGVKFNMTPALTCAFFTQKLSTVNYTIGG